MTDDAALDPSDVRLTAAECEMLGQDHAAAMLEQCADRIAALTQQKKHWHDQTQTISNLSNRLEQAEAERDALREDQLAKAATIARLMADAARREPKP